MAMDKAIDNVEMPAAINSQLRQAMAEEVYYDDPTDTCSTDQDDSRDPDPDSDDASHDVNFISVSTNPEADVEYVSETEGAQFEFGYKSTYTEDLVDDSKNFLTIRMKYGLFKRP